MEVSLVSHLPAPKTLIRRCGWVQFTASPTPHPLPASVHQVPAWELSWLRATHSSVLPSSSSPPSPNVLRLRSVPRVAWTLSTESSLRMASPAILSSPEAPFLGRSSPATRYVPSPLVVRSLRLQLGIIIGRRIQDRCPGQARGSLHVDAY